MSFAGSANRPVSESEPEMIAKRIFDLACVIPGLILLGPLLVLIALCVKFNSRGPVFFRQIRTGLKGKPFSILKFRSMVVDAERQGLQITASGDRRITHVGRILRKTKLDELPQLFNVLWGEMSLVGPRPEVPRYTDLYTPEQAEVLNFLPGITDPASIAFRHEESILAAAANPDEAYVREIMPAKIRINLDYQRKANVFTDCLVILQTFTSILSRKDGSQTHLPAASVPPSASKAD